MAASVRAASRIQFAPPADESPFCRKSNKTYSIWDFRLLTDTLPALPAFLAMLLTVSSSVAFGTPIFLNGTELKDAGAVFPTVQPTTIGTSILFGPGASGEKLFILPLLGANPGPNASISLDVSINLTRLACGSPACGEATYDFDPNIYLSDGEFLFGAVIADNDGGSALGATALEAPLVPSSRQLSPAIIVGAGYPDIGASFDISLEFLISGSSSSVTTSFLNSSGIFTEVSRKLNLAKGLDLVFVRDQDGHASEQYQINSVSIAAPIPEPASITLVVLGLVGTIRRRGLRHVLLRRLSLRRELTNLDS